MSFKEILSILSHPIPFVIATHKHCDGDSLGAGLALYHGLKKIEKEVSFFTLEKPHKKYDFLDEEKIIQIFEEKKTALKKDTALFFIDTNDHCLGEPLYSFAKKQGFSVCFIDHHPLIQKKSEDCFFIDSKASSSAEIIYSILKKMNIPLDEKIATALFTSIVFDTNLFRSIKNSAVPFSISSELIPYIKDVNLIYNNLFKTLTIDKLNFFIKVKKVEYYSNKKIAFLHLKEKDFKEHKTDITQAYDLMDMIKDISSIESTALVVENGDSSFKLSLRSHKKDLLPLAQSFGGGGHHHSAGAYISDKQFQDIKEKVISYLQS